MAEPSRGRPFLVPVAALRRRPGSALELDVAAPIPEMAVTDSFVPDVADASFHGRVESVIGGLSVKGAVRAPWQGICRRCLGEAHGELEATVEEICSDDADPDDGYPVDGDFLDLEPIVHDACILELPLAPLCQEDCRGLCPVCGANRNDEICSCEASDPRTE